MSECKQHPSEYNPLCILTLVRTALLNCAMQYIQEKAEPIGVLDVHEQQQFMRSVEQNPLKSPLSTSKRLTRNTSSFHPLRAKHLQQQQQQLPTNIFSSNQSDHQLKNHMVSPTSHVKFHLPAAATTSVTAAATLNQSRLVTNENTSISSPNFFSPSTSTLRNRQQSQKLQYQHQQLLLKEQQQVQKKATRSTSSSSNNFQSKLWNGFDNNRLLQIDILTCSHLRPIMMDSVNPYSIEAASSTLKEHFHTVIEPSDSQRKRYVARTVLPKAKKSNSKQQFNFQTTPQEEFLVLEQLKDQTQQQQNDDLQEFQKQDNQDMNLMMSPQAQEVSPFIDLNALMGSMQPVTNHTIHSSFLNQSSSKQQDNPRKKPKAFKIKRTGTQNAAPTSTSSALKKGQIDKISRTQLHSREITSSSASSTSSAGKFMSHTKPLMMQSEDSDSTQSEQLKLLPLFTLNFNKTLEKRLLLNSLGIVN